MPKMLAKSKQPHGPANGAFVEVLTLGEAAVYLRLPEKDVLRLIEEQGLPARRLDNEWRFLKSAIQSWLSAGTPLESSKAAWMKLVGAWRDDPFQEEFLREINKGRSLPKGEDLE